MKCFNSKSTGSLQQNLFDKRWRAGWIKIGNAFGILKNKFQISRNLNVDLNYASTIVVACCILHNFLIVERDISGEEIDQEVNSKFPMKKDLISIEENLSENIAKQQHNILFNMWVQQKYKKEK